MTYEKCRENYLENIIKEFENEKLKDRSGKIIKNRKQAIAIALDSAQRKCKYNDKELKQVEKKVMEFLIDDERKISKSRIPLTNVIETKVLIKNYINDNKKTKAKKLYFLLIERITNPALKNIKVTKNIWDEIKDINNLFLTK